MRLVFGAANHSFALLGTLADATVLRLPAKLNRFQPNHTGQVSYSIPAISETGVVIHQVLFLI